MSYGTSVVIFALHTRDFSMRGNVVALRTVAQGRTMPILLRFTD